MAGRLRECLMADYERRRRDTRQAAEFLTDLGYRTAPATLNKLRCVGGGPDFECFGRRPLYSEAALLNWAEARCTGPRRSTSERGEADAATSAKPRHERLRH